MRSPPRRLLSALALASLVLGAVAACATDDKTMVTLTIRRGSSFREAAESLAAHGVVWNARLFGTYAARMGRDRKIEYGTYFIRRGASWRETLDNLASGKGLVTRVTVIEGLPFWEMFPRLARQMSLPEDSFWVAARDTALLRALGVPRGLTTAEGYLFPDTYDFPDPVTARQAVTLMARRFERIWKPEWDARLAEIRMTRHEVVTLASIVEKEVRRGSERPRVASVYLNRLRLNMPLQADPTVQYAQRRRPGRVTYSDLRVNSPYNTYRRTGLPPGPIAAPGEKSLEAVLYPADERNLFFVAHPNGHHEFRRTYSEHLSAIRFVRAAAREDSIARADSVRRARADSVAAARAAAAQAKGAAPTAPAAPATAPATAPASAPATAPTTAPPDSAARAKKPR